MVFQYVWQLSFSVESFHHVSSSSYLVSIPLPIHVLIYPTIFQSRALCQCKYHWNISRQISILLAVFLSCLLLIFSPNIISQQKSFWKFPVNSKDLNALNTQTYTFGLDTAAIVCKILFMSQTYILIMQLCN